jgi:ABC-type multidrug transport system fused ATPase/permease subunit
MAPLRKAEGSAEAARVEGLPSALSRLYRHFSRRRRVQLVLILALMLAGALAELMTIGAVLPFLALIANPARAADMPLFGNLFARLGWRGDDLLLPATLLFITVALSAGAVRLLLAWASQKFVFRLGHDIGVEAYRRTLYQPYAFHIARNSSAAIANIDKVQTVVWNVLMPLMQAATAAVISTFILAALIAIDAAVALVAAAGFGMLYLGISLATRWRLRSNSQVIATAYAERIKSVQEGLGGIRDVLIDRAQPVYIGKFARVDSAYRHAQTVNAFIGAAPRFIIEAAGMALIALLALALAHGEGGFATALPVLGALALGAARLLPLLQLIYNSWAQIAGSRQNLLDVVEALDLPLPGPEVLRGTTGPPLPFERAITLEKVGFHYQPGTPAVLRGIDLVIPKGGRVGIVGKTGSGKSTLMDLVMGLLEPSEGAIRIDGEKLAPANIGRWQARIAHVPQAIYLSDASIAENIAFGIPPEEIDRERLREAARQAAVADFIESLPDGYDTFVGERGVRLSGGQRQRIGIARALYRQADVLVFDEATSALDSVTETAVMDAISRLGRELTILIIAHRVSTLEGCDMVVRLEGRASDNGRGNNETSGALPA